MRKTVKFLFSLILIFGLCHLASAQTLPSAMGYFKGNVRSVSVYSNGLILVSFDLTTASYATQAVSITAATSGSGTAAGPVGYNFFQIDSTQPFYKDQLAVALELAANHAEGMIYLSAGQSSQGYNLIGDIVSSADAYTDEPWVHL